VEKKERLELFVIAIGVCMLAVFLLRNIKMSQRQPSGKADTATAPAQENTQAIHPANKILTLQEKNWRRIGEETRSGR